MFLWKHGETSSRATYLPTLASSMAHNTSRQLLPDLVLVRKGSSEAACKAGGSGPRWLQTLLLSPSLGSRTSLSPHFAPHRHPTGTLRLLCTTAVPAPTLWAWARAGWWRCGGRTVSEWPGLAMQTGRTM